MVLIHVYLKTTPLLINCMERKEIEERHRHRYEVNNDYREVLEENGMSLCGLSPDSRIVEMVEILLIHGLSQLRRIRS